ncbi:MAG: S8 family serine peptidase [Bacteroidia bacterium]|nr:S8 family serine peptidase [Bacteroidia bacterium]
MTIYKLLILFSILLFTSFISAQTAPGKYRIRFTDKNDSPYSVSNPQEFLTQRAIQRRTAQNINITEKDIPVNQAYITAVKNLGATVYTKSKWFNCITVAAGPDTLNAILNLPFVAGYDKIVSRSFTAQVPFRNENTGGFVEKGNYKTDNFFDYGFATNQIEMLQGQILHNQGYQGQGMVIAILDAGFYHVNSLPAFDSLWANNQILGTWDFVDNDSTVYENHQHGMQVLSVMGGNIPGQLVGVAPKAKFWLLRTEDTNSEYVIEEDNWVSGAEFADSVGADIISTSLGYNTFDDPSQNHTYAMMDGNTTRISIGADMAAARGMLVVVSAGNDGSNSWYYIDAPADADSVLTAGAVDSSGTYVSFSSHGPTYDGRIKPNVAAQGFLTAISSTSGSIITGSGTSFSCPLIAGMAACLWQSNPGFTNMQLLNSIEMSANHYLTPDFNTGYGIPNFAQAYLILQGIKYNDLTKDFLLRAYPNPFVDDLNIKFYSVDSQSVNIKITDLTGRTVYSKDMVIRYNSFYTTRITGLSVLSNGVYFLRISTDNDFYVAKLIKRQ